MRASDGVATYCIKFDGDAEEYPYHLKVIGDYLLLAGTATSSQFKNNPSATYGNFVLWIRKDLQTTACSVLNVEEDTSLVWTDEALPMKTINLADVNIATTTLFVTSVPRVLTYPTYSLHSICMIDAPSVPGEVSAPSA